MALKDDIYLVHLRHKEALEESLGYLEQAMEGISNRVSYELIAFDMRSSLKALGTIIGVDITEEVLTKIFSTFCIGK